MNLIQASNSKQMSNKCINALDCSSLQLVLFLSCLKSFSTAFDHGIYGSNCFNWLFTFLIKLTLDNLVGTVTNTSWQDTTPCKQKGQDLMCFTSGCHREGSSTIKVSGMYLSTSVASSRYCTVKQYVWKYTMCKAMISKMIINYSKLSGQWGVEHSPNSSLGCDLNSLLGFLQGHSPSLGKDYRF